MTGAKLIDGRAEAAALRATIKRDVAKLAEAGITPGLAVILVGDDPASQIYVDHKITACKKTGIRSFAHRLPATTTQADLNTLITTLNADDAVHGILLQLPLPAGLDSDQALEAIDPAKDVDGLHPLNVGRLVSGRDGLYPCTPQGCLHLIKTVREDLTGQLAVIIGSSLLVGRPMGQLLLQEGATIIQCHSQTRDLPGLCRQADIIVTATGQPHLVKGDWIKPGAIITDIGITRLEDGTLAGDVDFEAAREKAAAITPVPGGVGPMTIAYLLENTLRAAKVKNGINK